jgi:Cytochrome c7 and related cytochrome c
MRFSVALGVSISLAVVAACGSPPPASPPPTPPPAASASPSSTSPVPAPTASAAPSSNPAPTPSVGLGNTMPIQPSKLVEDAKRLGIDFKQTFASMSLQQKKRVMPLFVKSLGYDGCTGCHVEGDFEKETRNMKVARAMWDHFVVGLRDAQGAPLFCDSCHGGRAKTLDRSSPDGIKKVMETDYQGKLTRADKKPHDCSGCHGNPPELKVIEKVWGIAAN